LLLKSTDKTTGAELQKGRQEEKWKLERVRQRPELSDLVGLLNLGKNAAVAFLGKMGKAWG